MLGVILKLLAWWRPRRVPAPSDNAQLMASIVRRLGSDG